MGVQFWDKVVDGMDVPGSTFSCVTLDSGQFFYELPISGSQSLTPVFMRQSTVAFRKFCPISVEVLPEPFTHGNLDNISTRRSRRPLRSQSSLGYKLCRKTLSFCRCSFSTRSLTCPWLCYDWYDGPDSAESRLEVVDVPVLLQRRRSSCNSAGKLRFLRFVDRDPEVIADVVVGG